MPKETIALEEMAARFEALAVFRPLLQDETLARLLVFLKGEETDRPRLYSHFVAKLYEEGGDLGAYLQRRVRECPSIALRLRAKKQATPVVMAKALENELFTFTALSFLPAEAFTRFATAHLKPFGVLPAIQNTPQDFASSYTAQLAKAEEQGYGIFATHAMFTLCENGELLPVKHPDSQRFAQLVGYQRERWAITQNTLALLRGLPAGNILLYGDAGTGKSSTVKALVNEYKAKGLRLVEVQKTQLAQLPALMDELAENPLKFILFIDDLSFSTGEAGFTSLKAILEGGAAARPNNLVVYATSNRRHLLREGKQSRVGNEINLADTLEEEASLAARFGLTVTFLKPDRALFQEIVLALAKEYALRTSPEELLQLAEAHTLRHGGRNPRAALQFVQWRKAYEESEGELPPK